MTLQAAIDRKDGEAVVIHAEQPITVRVKSRGRGRFKVFVESPQKVLVDREETLTPRIE